MSRLLRVLRLPEHVARARRRASSSAANTPVALPPMTQIFIAQPPVAAVNTLLLASGREIASIEQHVPWNGVISEA